MPSDIDFKYALANDAEFRDQLAYAMSPVLGTILEDNGDGTYDVDASDGDGGELIARPLDQRTYGVGDFVWCMLAFGVADSAIILGSYNPHPTTLEADTVITDALNLGEDDLTVYNEGIWTPTLTGSSGAPTITYTTQNGQFTQIGNVVFYTATIVINTISGGSGDVRCTLPSANARSAVGVANLSGVDTGASTVHVNFSPTASQSFGTFREVQDNAAVNATQISALAAGDTLAYSGFYFAA